MDMLLDAVGSTILLSPLIVMLALFLALKVMSSGRRVTGWKKLYAQRIVEDTNQLTN